MKKISNWIPEERCYISDFKCPAPFNDEMELLMNLARFAQVKIFPKMDVGKDGRKMNFLVQHKRSVIPFTMEHLKYQFPPVEIIHCLNEILYEMRSEYQLVPCINGSTWEDFGDGLGEGPMVLLISKKEYDELKAAGIFIIDPSLSREAQEKLFNSK